jgi:O-antigen/teichoic acid export membrane protein
MLKRILKILFALSIGQAIIRLSSFILIPLFVNYWSTNKYGEWLALSAAIGYLASLDLGISQASTNKMIQSYALGDINRFKSTQHSSLFLFILIALVFSLVISISIWFFPINKWLGIIEITEFQSKLVLILLSLYMLWALPFRIIYSAYHSLGKLAKLQWIDNFQKISYLIIIILLLILTQDIILIASVQLLLMVATFFYVLYDLRKNYSLVFPGIKCANKNEMKTLLIPGLYFVLYIFSNLFWMQGSIVLISGVFGGLVVAVFSISRTLSLLSRQTVDSFYYSMFPDIAALFAKQEFNKLKQIHKLLVFISFSIALTITVIFWFYGKEIIYLWTVGKVEVDETLLRLLLILITFQTPFIASASILLATNNHKKFTLLFLAANLAGLVLSILLIEKFGIYIIPLSFMLSEAVFCYYFVIRDTCAIIEKNSLNFILSFLKYIFPLVLLVFAVSYLINYFLLNLNSVTKLIVGISLTLSISSLLVWFIFPGAEKEFLIKKVKELIIKNG